MKWIGLVVSLAAGAACGWVLGHILGPAPQTRFDATYQSRWDRALAEGQTAAAERAQALRLEFERKRRPQSVA